MQLSSSLCRRSLHLLLLKGSGAGTCGGGGSSNGVLKFQFAKASTTAGGPSPSSSSPNKGPSPPPPAGSTTTSSLSNNNQKWDIFASVVVERRPIITRDRTPLEQEYGKLLDKYEFERSRKSTHEIRKEKDKKIIEKIKAGELEADQAAAVTAQDEEDLWTAELGRFTPAPRTTEADKKQDLKSLQRALDSHLLLVIQQKLGKDYVWCCPQGRWIEGETMRQTADRILKEVSPEVKAKVLGNAPWGFYKYKYPKKAIAGQQLEAVGAKVFFYKAQILEGEVQLKTKKGKDDSKGGGAVIDFKDFQWLKREELDSKLHPEYHRHICEFLIDETN